MLLCAIAVDQFAELTLLADNTSNDFTLKTDAFAAQTLMTSVANLNSISLYPLRCQDERRIRQPETFDVGEPSSTDFLLLSVLRT